MCRHREPVGVVGDAERRGALLLRDTVFAVELHFRRGLFFDGAGGVPHGDRHDSHRISLRLRCAASKRSVLRLQQRWGKRCVHSSRIWNKNNKSTPREFGAPRTLERWRERVGARSERVDDAGQV